MKKTLNINLAGYPFIIDEDAYNLLKDYLDTIRYAFVTTDDTEDLAADIESRIAEILLEKNQNLNKIVSLSEISQVIERIGQPSDFIEIETETVNPDREETQEKIEIKEEPQTPPPYTQAPPYSRNPFVRKKIFRDPQNALLGGVCSGLASYLNMDVTIVRLIAVILFFFSASTVAIVYIILWIVLPSANTPLQRMQMKGESPTMENIGRNVTENFQNEEGGIPPGDTQSRGGGFLNNLFSIFVKCLVILGMIIAFPLLIVLGATLIGCMIAVFVIGIGIFSGGMFDSFNEGLMVLFILLAVIGGAITLGIPLWLLIQKVLRKRELNHTPSTQRSILIIWLIGIAMVAVFSTKAVRTGKKLDHENWGFNSENLEKIEKMKGKNVENLIIEDGKLLITTKDGQKIVINNGNVSIEEINEEETTVPIDSISTTFDSLKILESNTLSPDTLISK